MWEDRYNAEDGYLFGEKPAQVLIENTWAVEGSHTALCVADGEGRNSVHLARTGLEVAAFDLSPTAVRRANELATTAGVSLEILVSDWSNWDWARQFDLVVAIFVQFVGHDARIQQFADLKAAVKPGGRLFIHGYRPEQISLGTGGPPIEENMYTETMLKDMFCDWKIERLASYERDVQEGRGHSGKSALIDLVVRRPD